jgi:hypothetical protein
MFIKDFFYNIIIKGKEIITRLYCEKWLGIFVVSLLIVSALPFASSVNNTGVSDSHKEKNPFLSDAQLQQSPGTGEISSDEPQVTQGKNDDYCFFTFAIIWGKFDVLESKIPLFNLTAGNRYTFNRTMSVIGWVTYEHRFIFKKSNRVSCDWWLGFVVGSNRLCVVGWGLVNA